MNKNKIESVQVLRAIAAISVVLFHTNQKVVDMYERYGITRTIFNNNLYDMGVCGVDIFFVISGFIMAMITKNLHKTPNAVREFAYKRIIRIVPPYWLWTLVLLAVLYFLPHMFSRLTFNFKEAILSLLFIPYIPVGLNSSPVLAVGWTLSYEMYFYALICVGLFFPRKIFIAGLGVFFLITTTILYYADGDGPILYLVKNPILWEFFCGILLFEIFMSDNIYIYIAKLLKI